VTELVRFDAHGHPAIRATHAKTLEFTVETAITGRATCVVGVAARLPSLPVAGPIELTIMVAGESVSCRAVGNSAWWPGSGSAVIRRSRQRLPDTLATDAELAADGLPRHLVRALASPDATLSVLIERRAGPPGGTLVRCFRPGVAPDRLMAEAAAADAVIAEDSSSGSWLSSIGIASQAAGSASSTAACLAAGGRVLAVTDFGSAGAGSALLAAAGGVEVLGLPAEAAVSAAAPDRSPVLQAGHLASRELPALAGTNPSAALVVRCPAERLPGLLAGLGRDGAQLVLVPAGDPERPVRGSLSEIQLPERGEVVCRVAGLPGAAPAAPVEPRALVRELLAQSVTPRTIALAVAALPGWSRRSAYEFVLAVAGEITPSG
jgi:hypothetical protein